MLLVIVEAAVDVDLEALEAVVHDEVHDPRDRIGAIDGRCAAGQQFHPLDQRRRDLVQVGRIGVGTGTRAAWGQTPAIDEHQVAGRTEVPQVHVGRPGCAVGARCPLAGIDLGQLIEQILGLGVTVELDVLRVQGGDRAGAFDVHLRNARAGDFDSLDLLGGLLRDLSSGLRDLSGGLRGLSRRLLRRSGLLRRLLCVSDLRRHQREREFGCDDGRLLYKHSPRAFVVAHLVSPKFVCPSGSHMIRRRADCNSM